MSNSLKLAVNDEITLLPSIVPLTRHYDYFIIDIFGVIHDGLRPFPGTLACLQNLKDLGIETCLLSNSPKRARGAIDQMKSMGISEKLFSHVVTSGEATHDNLLNRSDAFHKKCGHDCWFIGTNEMRDMLDGLDLNIHAGPQNASFILNAIPGTGKSEVEKLKEQMAIAQSRNLPMICSNPDLVVNIGDKQYECAGTFAKYYEELGGEVLYHGKPHGLVYDKCWDLFGKPDKSKIIALGDSLHTDIAGANSFGIDSAFNLVGIHWEEVQMDHRPGEADRAKVLNVVRAQKHQPTFVLSGFHW